MNCLTEMSAPWLSEIEGKHSTMAQWIIVMIAPRFRCSELIGLDDNDVRRIRMSHSGPFPKVED